MNNLNKTVPLNFVRAQKAVRPTTQQIKEAVQLANEKYRNGHRHFLPEVYTR